ncbi:peptidase S8 [Aliidiomarina minuta]|uniref:Peptidase S8 n=1 Tax=Aliidiomarina minuta TaxID=880057 RepID=A0A432W9J3_9GAMM|nr:S8 family peptidase [Aliidiomarina minuta]RUO26823.1 peptidase S8 [Aliidiomarina minuta]
MKKTTTLKLSLISLSLIAASGVTLASSESPLKQTEVAKPAPPGQVQERQESGIPSQAQSLLRDVRIRRGPTDSVIVRFKADRDPEVEAKIQGNPSERGALMQVRAQQLSRNSGQQLRFQRSMGLPHTHVFEVEGGIRGRDSKAALAAILNDPSVEFVEENRVHTIMQTPNDPGYDQQWHYYENVGGLNAPGAWSEGITGQGTVVAVLDTGYRPHADLNANILPGYDMISDPWRANDGTNGRDSDARDPGDWVQAGACGSNPAQNSSWHGTHVAGTIAAVTNNNQGVAGVAYDASILPVRVLGRCGGTTADIADGILWAAGASVPGVPGNANPADVINLSLGGGGACQSVTQQAINTARGNGAAVVVASGNSNTNADGFSPSNCNGVISVAATNRNGGRASYSNYGNSVTLAAPGGQMTSANDPGGVLSTYNSGTTTPASDNYSFSQGTSMAAPHVAAVAALIKEASPGASPADIEQFLVANARSFPATCNGCGAGIADAGASVQAALGGGSGGNGGGSGSVDNLSAATNEWNRFTFDIPSGMSTLEVIISGGTGDADLYIRHGSQPTLQDWDCRPYLNGNNEVCTVNNPAAGVWHLGVHAYQAYSGVRLEASYQP